MNNQNDFLLFIASSVIENKQKILHLMIFLTVSSWGAAASAYMSHEGKKTGFWKFIEIGIGKMFVGSFAGFLAGMLSIRMGLGVFEGCVVSGIAGLMGKEFLDTLKEKYKGRIIGK